MLLYSVCFYTTNSIKKIINVRSRFFSPARNLLISSRTWRGTMRRYSAAVFFLSGFWLPAAALAEQSPPPALTVLPAGQNLQPAAHSPGQFFPLNRNQQFRPLPRTSHVTQETPPAPAGAKSILPSEMTREQAEQIISIFAAPQ
jgi:hypothetical protein